MSQKKILIVDDNLVIVKALTLKLQSSGYEVITAEDGAGAVGKARQQRPDLIVLDINFPPDVAHGGGVPWDAFLIMDWLRRMEEIKDTPFIIITGGDAQKFRQRALSCGAVAFFPKPVNNEELLSAIRNALGEEVPPTS